MSIHAVTYATHNQGLFDKLINNDVGVKVEVLGWNTKWNGFKDKFIGVYEFCNSSKCNDDDIVVFIDGFDSSLKTDIETVKSRFLEMNCKTLFSKDALEINSVFGKCLADGTMLNTGLYMGYVKYLKLLLKDAINDTCKDDQRSMNTLCGKYSDIITVDTDCRIFKNYSPFDKLKTVSYNTCIVSYPGSASVNRYVRSIKEYAQFFYKYVVLMWLMALYFFRKDIDIVVRYLVPIMAIFLCLYYTYADRSCSS